MDGTRSKISRNALYSKVSFKTNLETLISHSKPSCIASAWL